MPWNPMPSAFVVDQVYGFQTAEKFRQNGLTLVSRRAGRPLGGSREVPNAPVATPLTGLLRSKHYGLGPFDAYEYVDVEIDGTNQAGITHQARVAVRVAASGLTITPKVRNVTDSTDAGVGVACTAADPAYGGANQKQTIALTIAVGVKTYRLQYTLNSPSGDSWCGGELESFATS